MTVYQAKIMSAATPRLPVYFIPHGGGPCFFMDWQPRDTWLAIGEFLRALADDVGARPTAIVVVSGHWEEPGFTVNNAANPALMYDYSGFPAHTYQLTYPVPGEPALAAQIQQLLREAGLPTAQNSARGLDHGVFIPFKLIYPDADIPIVQLSLQRGLDPAAHIRAGEALAPLRDQGVLIVGSGMSYHNLRGFGPAYAEPSQQFDAWLTQSISADSKQRHQRLLDWQNAPSAQLAHPRAEHLLPLMVVAGAAGIDQGLKIFEGQIPDVTVSAFRFG